MPYGDQIHAVLAAVARSLGSVDPRWALLAAALHVAHHLLRSLAWRNVLRAAEPDRPVGLFTVAACYATGVALNALTPARGGDAVKVALLRTRMPGTSVVTLASSMSVVLVFDSVVATGLIVGVWGLGVVPAAPALPADPMLAVLAAGAVVVVALLVRRRFGPRVRALLARLRRGGAILRTPRRYLREVVLVQAFAWACRLGVVICLLAAFDLPASIPLGAAVLVFAGLSSLVPLTPGGAGGQQVLVAVALQGAATTAGAVSFSIGMQAGITLVNGALGVVAAMLLFRTLRPWAALRAATAR
jgi:uncharacterized membrane protein YbhN (UPF0104 family)